ncbi:MAG: Trm112 family protein [Holosporaceae bacterium]|jgi:uncharacterized protein YbaR (Trm112 family)|nr:Trm112 family protein [Holosporaceae bacterium]
MKETPLISEDLLKLLICPKSGGTLKMESDKLTCEESSTSYAIKDGIPIMFYPEN